MGPKKEDNPKRLLTRGRGMGAISMKLSSCKSGDVSQHEIIWSAQQWLLSSAVVVFAAKNDVHEECPAEVALSLCLSVEHAALKPLSPYYSLLYQ